MKPIPLIRVAALQPFTSFLDELGAAVETLWIRAGLPPQLLDEPAAFVPLHTASAFLDAAARREDIAELGIVVARRPGACAPGPHDERRTTTLEQALAASRQHLALHCSGVRSWIALDGAAALLCKRWSVADDRGWQLDLFAVARLVELVRRAADPEWRPVTIDLQGSSGDVRGLERSLGVPVRAGCGKTTVAVDRHLLSWPLRTADLPLAQVDGQLDGGPLHAPPGDLVGSVLVVIHTLLAAGRPGIETTAHAAGISARTLQRWLADAGTSHSDLLDRTRFARATQLLEDTTTKVVEVALRLGYSDHAHFTRAFRRWSGASPIQHRETHRSARKRLQHSA